MIATKEQAEPEQMTSDSTSMVEQTLDGKKLADWETNAGRRGFCGKSIWPFRWDGATSEEDLDYTIRLLYGAEVNR